MVIYWFGFIDDLQHSCADLILVDAFPTFNLTQLPRLHVPPDLLPSCHVTQNCIDAAALADVEEE